MDREAPIPFLLPESEAESSRRRATLSIATLLLLVALCALFGATQLRRDGSASRGGTSSLAVSAAASAVGGEEGWEAGQRNPHPWQHDRKSTTIDSQKDSGLNCLDPTASAVLGGVDVVAYWSADERANASYGFANNSLSWSGYLWYFATPANRAAFMKAPRKYAPQWGGFCAYGIANEPFWNATNLGPDTDPDTWRILDGKLYLFMYCTPEHLFMAQHNLSSVVAAGNDRWNGWFNHTPVYNVQCMWTTKDRGGEHANASDGCFEEDDAEDGDDDARF